MNIKYKHIFKIKTRSSVFYATFTKGYKIQQKPAKPPNIDDLLHAMVISIDDYQLDTIGDAIVIV